MSGNDAVPAETYERQDRKVVAAQEREIRAYPLVAGAVYRLTQAPAWMLIDRAPSSGYAAAVNQT